jgi:hypothetical protein
VYMVPAVKEHSTPRAVAPSVAVHPPPVTTSLNIPHSSGLSSSSGAMSPALSSSAPATPQIEKRAGTMKGFNFKDAKEKMMRKKKEKELSNSPAQLRSRKSASLAIPDDVLSAARRRSSTGLSSDPNFVQMQAFVAQAESHAAAGNSGASGGRSSDRDGEDAFPGIRLAQSGVTSEVKVEVLKVMSICFVLFVLIINVIVKDCMAAGPLSPDCREGGVLFCNLFVFHFCFDLGDVLVATRCDIDGNVEVIVRGRPHLVPLNCVQPLPLENPTSDQKLLVAEIVNKKKIHTGSVHISKQGLFVCLFLFCFVFLYFFCVFLGRKESVLGALRTKMRGGEKGVILLHFYLNLFCVFVIEFMLFCVCNECVFCFLVSNL